MFSLGFVEMIPSPWLGFLRGVFLANHLASNDNFTRTTKIKHIPTQNSHTQKGTDSNTLKKHRR